VFEGFDEEAACTASGIQDDVAKLRVDLLGHEANHWPRRVELARVARGVAHLSQHRLVQVRHRVDVVTRCEVDLVDLVDNVAKEVPGQHPVVGLAEHRCDHVPRVVGSRSA
jgi:tRNA isopentenyl-2-thiomethyl-A-37 hydroxylase MiaE